MQTKQALFRLTGILRGPGHASCKELSVVTQDGPARHIRFRLKPIKHDFGKVLCMADAKTLRKTAEEVLRLEGATSTSMVPLLEWEERRPATESQTQHKSKAFWTVFSKRFKASMPIMSAVDTVHVLRAFHEANKDTGVFVVAAPILRHRTQELDKKGLVDALHILSRRLKHNTQQQLFRTMADHVPNVLWQMSAADVVATLWHLSRAGLADKDLAAYMQPKFCDTEHTLDDIGAYTAEIFQSRAGRGTAALAFARHGHTDAALFRRIEAGMGQDCSGEALFRAAWGMHMAGVDVDALLGSHLLTCLQHIQQSDSRATEVWRTILRDSDLYHTAFGQARGERQPGSANPDAEGD
ncbi:hypothetical protein, conserved [Babesia ovata]|uniref:Uncharacterized protein n=1 Tax=Babesia ovata TaxID=189622 RepID=A0A2H6K898_9APIC|nr:uncharacterized protein BOVATA_007160 [Babesia ovata]GBE59223.1 hypothetical protein, conserved [Babesia ovata]